MSEPTPLAASDFSRQSRLLWQRVLRLIADRNPFYLISAACMLWGCLAMTNSHSWNSIPLTRLIVLIGTINFYEGMLIGLAVLLLRRGLGKDGNLLLVLQAFFLLDVTFLSAEIATANFSVGVLVNAVVLALAVVKIRVVSGVLSPRMSMARQGHLLIQLTALLGIPSVLRHIDHGSVPAGDFYVLWWVVGLMPVVGEALRRWGEANNAAAAPRGVALQRAGWPVGTYFLLPWLSLIAHLGILHYVYDVPFFGAMAAPVILGFTFVLHGAMPGVMRDLPMRLLPADLRQVRSLQVVAPAVAVLVSLNNPHELALSLHPVVAATLSTSMLAVAGAYLTYIYCLLPAQAPLLLLGGMAVAIYSIFGPSVDETEQALVVVWNWCEKGLMNIVPTTMFAWGMLSVIASFGFLAVGAAVSFGGRGAAPVLPVEDGGSEQAP